MKEHSVRRLAAMVVLLLAVAGWPAASRADSTNAALTWDDATLQGFLVRDWVGAPNPMGPPEFSRTLAIVHTCMYDAWAAYDATAVGTRLGGTLRRPPAERTDANRQEAISFAAYKALAELIPAGLSIYQGAMAGLGYDPANQSTDTTTPAGIGNVACQAVLDFRHHDGSNQLGDLHPGMYSDYTGYKPVNSPMAADQPIDPATVVDAGRWQPLIYTDSLGNRVTQRADVPQWNKVIPFALTSASQFRSTGGAKPGSVPYITQAVDLVLKNALLNDDQKMQAEYWYDAPGTGLAPGHWMEIAQFASRRDAHTMNDDVKMFFALSNAMLDAEIAAWDDKAAFDSERPITAIRSLFNGVPILGWGGPGQGAQLIDGGSWHPYALPSFPTPPDSEYVSGSAAVAAAAAEILKRFCGSDTYGGSASFAAGSSAIEPGITPASPLTLSWPTFTDAASQAATSGEYGGVHFAQADTDGLATGRQVAGAAWSVAQSFFNPS